MLFSARLLLVLLLEFDGRLINLNSYYCENFCTIDCSCVLILCFCYFAAIEAARHRNLQSRKFAIVCTLHRQLACDVYLVSSLCSGVMLASDA